MTSSLRPGAFGALLIVLPLVFAAATAGAFAQDDGKAKAGRDKQKDQLAERHKLDVGERVYEGLGHAAGQTKNVRLIVRRLRDGAYDGMDEAVKKKEIAAYHELVKNIEKARAAVADVLVQMAECTALCARADRAAADGKPVTLREHRGAMGTRTAAARLSARKLAKFAERLAKSYAKLGDAEGEKLAGRLGTECKGLAKSLRDVEAVLAGKRVKADAGDDVAVAPPAAGEEDDPAEAAEEEKETLRARALERLKELGAGLGLGGFGGADDEDEAGDDDAGGKDGGGAAPGAKDLPKVGAKPKPRERADGAGKKDGDG